MFVTEHFVFLHLPKTAGIYVESVWEQNLRLPILFSRRHTKWSELPPEFSALPTIGVRRDPWDWYASLYFFAQAERNAATSELVALASDHFALGFEATLGRLLVPDEAFISSFERRMRELGGKGKDFECLDVGSLRRQKESGLGLLGFLTQEIMPSRLDTQWRFESLRKEMFAYFSPLSPNRERFREAMVSPARNVSGKPSLELIYTPEAIRAVAKAERGLIEAGGYRAPKCRQMASAS